MLRAISWGLCRLPVKVGHIVWSTMTANTVERKVADAAIELHRRWDWGEASTAQRKYNDQAAFYGGTVQSVYPLTDGRRVHVITFECRCGLSFAKGTTTIVCLTSEIPKMSRCDCMTADVPPHLWPQNNLSIPPSVMEAWETILFHIAGPWQ